MQWASSLPTITSHLSVVTVPTHRSLLLRRDGRLPGWQPSVAIPAPAQRPQNPQKNNRKWDPNDTKTKPKHLQNAKGSLPLLFHSQSFHTKKKKKASVLGGPVSSVGVLVVSGVLLKMSPDCTNDFTCGRVVRACVRACVRGSMFSLPTGCSCCSLTLCQRGAGKIDLSAFFPPSLSLTHAHTHTRRNLCHFLLVQSHHINTGNTSHANICNLFAPFCLCTTHRSAKLQRARARVNTPHSCCLLRFPPRARFFNRYRRGFLSSAAHAGRAWRAASLSYPKAQESCQSLSLSLSLTRTRTREPLTFSQAPTRFGGEELPRLPLLRGLKNVRFAVLS